MNGIAISAQQKINVQNVFEKKLNRLFNLLRWFVQGLKIFK